MDQAVGSNNADQQKAKEDNGEILNRVGFVARMLHDSLRALGYDKVLEQVAVEIPDARDRLDYVVKMTHQAAEKVFTATDAATPLQESIGAGAEDLAALWHQTLLTLDPASPAAAAAKKTIDYLNTTVTSTTATKALMLEIVMAQDFQDLTGQVIQRVTSLSQTLEQQLIQVLMDFSPNYASREVDNGLLNGPQINPNAKDVMASQSDVDDLLGSLGF
jgi:chemotaxis protein CheZ